MLTLLTLLAIIISIYKYKIIRIKKRNKELERAVNERTASLKKANEMLEKEVKERKKAEDAIKKIAYYDPLTHLLNRRLFMELGEHELSNAKRNKESLSILFIDLDKFKSVNDTYGHEAGDILLIEISERLKGLLRKNDIVCRIGGAEFIILLKDIKQKQEVAIVIEKIIQKIIQPVQIDEEVSVAVGASVGCSFFPLDSEDFEELIKKADGAMYKAKEVSEPCYQIHDEIYPITPCLLK